jgi:hypothetical protein
MPVHRDPYRMQWLGQQIARSIAKKLNLVTSLPQTQRQVNHLSLSTARAQVIDDKQDLRSP